LSVEGKREESELLSAISAINHFMVVFRQENCKVAKPAREMTNDQASMTNKPRKTPFIGH